MEAGESVRFLRWVKPVRTDGFPPSRQLHRFLIVVGAGLIALIVLPGISAAAQRPADDAAAKSNETPEGLRFAHGLLRQRKFDLAAEEYQRFLDSRPARQDADDARFGLASARLFQGRYKEARKAFQDFLDQSPRHQRARTAWYRLGELSYMLSDLPAARKALETFTAGDAGHPNLETAWTYLGDVCFGMGDLTAARAAYKRALADFPHGQLVDRSRYGLGRSLAGLGENDAALRALSELAKNGSADWVDRAWFQIGRIQLAADHCAQAVEAFETLNRVAPRSSLKSEADFSRAEALARLDHAAEAEKLLEPLIAQGGESLAPRAALEMATLQLKRGDGQRALVVLNDTLKRHPQSPMAPALRFRSAEARETLKQTAEARKEFLEIAEAAPGDSWADDALARAARLALEDGDRAAALELARSFPKRFPSSPLLPEMAVIEGRALFAAGQAREAVQVLEPILNPGKGPAAKLAPAVVSAAKYDLALAYRAMGHSAQADALLAGLAEKTQDKVSLDAQFLIGQEQARKGQFAEALKSLELYLSGKPDGDVADHAMAHLAVAQLGLGKNHDAWKTLERMAERFPKSKALPATRLRLAEAALAANDAERAARQFELLLGEAPAAVPADPELRKRARLGQGRALWKLGKPAEAAASLGKFLKEFPQDAQAKVVALDHAEALAAAKRTDAALAAYQQIAVDHPKSKEAYQAELARARLLARTGKPGEGAEVLGGLLAEGDQVKVLEALRLKRDDLLSERAWALLDSGKTSAADDLFRQVLKDSPDGAHAVEARFNLAESASQARDPAEVVRLLSPLVASPAPPGEEAATTWGRIMPLALYRLGRTQIEQGDWAAAEKTLDRMIRDFPQSTKLRAARLLKAEAALRLDHAAEAETALATLENEPANAADPPGFALLVRLRHVQSLLGVKRWNDALTRAEALKRELPQGDPAVAELDFARGRALLGLARLDEARAALQAVIDARKGGDLAAQAHVIRGETYFHQDRFREALGEFLKVDLLYDAPRWQAAALLEAGKVYERLSQWSDAVETYDRLCSRFPDDPRVPEARTRLEAARKHGTARKESAGKLF